MVERHDRLDAVFEQRVDQPRIEIESSRIRAAGSLGQHARPGGAEAIRLDAQLAHQPHVVGKPAVVIARHVAVVAAVRFCPASGRSDARCSHRPRRPAASLRSDRPTSPRPTRNQQEMRTRTRRTPFRVGYGRSTDERRRDATCRRCFNCDPRGAILDAGRLAVDGRGGDARFLAGGILDRDFVARLAVRQSVNQLAARPGGRNRRLAAPSFGRPRSKAPGSTRRRRGTSSRPNRCTRSSRRGRRAAARE